MRHPARAIPMMHFTCRGDADFDAADVTEVTVRRQSRMHTNRVKRGRSLAVLLVALVLGGAGPGDRETSAYDPAAVRQMIAAGRVPGLRWPDISDCRASLAQVYQANEYRSFWIEQGGLEIRAKYTLQMLGEARSKGLDPEDYDASLLAAWSSTGAEASRLELGITVGLMRYASALHEGRIDPREVRFAIRRKGRLDTSAFLREYLRQPAEKLPQYLRSIEPPFRGYRNLQAHLNEYLQLAAKPALQLPSWPGRAVKPGQPYPGAGALAARLAVLGDLPAGAEPAQTGVYEGDLVAAVKKLQIRHGLMPTGTLDAETWEALSVPLSQRIEQMRLTLERWRWLPDTVRPAIVINIPEFELRAYNEDRSLALRMHVIVGKAWRHRTPVFEDTLQSVIVRPHWNVPGSIQRNEIVPALRGDPEYLIKHNMVVVDQRNQPAEAGSSQDLLGQLAAGRLRVRQNPGPSNSLGLLKFDFPNVFDVYLHGTPAQQLFSRARRDFSHGCIRVEDPVALAEWVLHDQPEWDRGHILAAMTSSKSRVIPVHRDIAVLVLYGTAVAEDNGEVHFFDDLYGYDAELQKALPHRNPWPRSATDPTPADRGGSSQPKKEGTS